MQTSWENASNEKIFQKYCSQYSNLWYKVENFPREYCENHLKWYSDLCIMQMNKINNQHIHYFAVILADWTFNIPHTMKERNAIKESNRNEQCANVLDASFNPKIWII